MRKNLLIIVGIAAGLVLACVVGLIIYGAVGFSRSDIAAGDTQQLWAPGAIPEAEEVANEAETFVESPPPEPGVYDTAGTAYAAEHLIIRTGNISMVVEDTRGAQATIEGMVAGMVSEGAFVVSIDEYGGTEGNQPQIMMSIRVPAARFDQVMDRLAELAVTVTSSNESSQDVTEEYVDLEARMESLEAARQRLLEIMQEARVTKDLLEAEQQLTQREVEIESIKGRMQYLEQSARLSSIWIELQPYILSQPVSDQWRPAETARRAVETLVDGLQGFGDFLIFFAIAILPWLVVIALVFLFIVVLVRWRGRARRARQATDSEAPNQK